MSFFGLRVRGEVFYDVGSSVPQVIRMAFNRSVATQYGTTIKPPTISSRGVTGDESTYFEAAQSLAEKYPSYARCSDSISGDRGF